MPGVSERLLVVVGGIVFPALTLTALLEVAGEQWWWRVRYPDFETANEIRVPVGRSVELVLRSADVIHSFWVPALAGKVDMIPGRTNRLRLRADRPGEFRGQCAEYCGGAHALMALHVVSLKPEAFAQWAAGQRQSSRKENPLFVARCPPWRA